MTNLSDFISSAFWRVNPPDADPTETREWLDAFDVLVETEGRERATFLQGKLLLAKGPDESGLALVNRALDATRTTETRLAWTWMAAETVAEGSDIHVMLRSRFHDTVDRKS